MTSDKERSRTLWTASTSSFTSASRRSTMHALPPTATCKLQSYVVVKQLCFCSTISYPPMVPFSFRKVWYGHTLLNKLNYLRVYNSLMES